MRYCPPCKATGQWKQVRTIEQYGITRQDFEKLLAKQGFACAICRKKAKLNIDHCHLTKQVRGLLCGNCNTGLGMFADDIVRFENAIKYIQACPELI